MWFGGKSSRFRLRNRFRSLLSSATGQEEVEVMVGEPGPLLGQWLPCQIRSPGDWPGTYHISLAPRPMIFV